MSPVVVLQLIALVLVGVLVVEVTLLALWTGSTTILGVLISALVGYAGLLSWAFLGDREAWPRPLFEWIWQKFFSAIPRLLASCTILLMTTAAGGVLLFRAWPVSVVGIITFNQEPMKEQVEVTVRTSSREPVVLSTTNSRFELRLSRTDADAPIFVSAKSKNFRTESLIGAKPGTVSVPMIRRHTLTIEVSNPNDIRFRPNGLEVIGREAAPEAQPVKARTDEAGFAYFEAAKGSRWRVTVIADKRYTSPFFTVEPLPFTFVANLSNKNFWSFPEPSVGLKELIEPVVHTESLSPELVKAFAAAGRKAEAVVVAKAVKERHDPNLVNWAPKAARLLVRTGYLAGHNDAFKIPEWVAYVLEGQSNDWPRPFDAFRPDPNLPSAVAATSQDYRGSGYDRGNLVSGADMRYKSRKALEEAYYLSTVCPQTPNLNRTVWFKIEESGRRAVKLFEKVYIFAGPAFLQEEGAQRLVIPFIGPGRVAVPTHFFRIHVAKVKGEWQAQTFLVPNQLTLQPDISRYVVSINRVEAVSGLEFFGSFSEPERSALKSQTPTALWQ